MGGTRPRYAQHSGAVFSLKYHVVWCPKYRREVLVPPVDTRLKKIIGTVAAEYGFTVHAMEVMPDHVVPKKGIPAAPRRLLSRRRLGWVTGTPSGNHCRGLCQSEGNPR